MNSRESPTMPIISTTTTTTLSSKTITPASFSIPHSATLYLSRSAIRSISASSTSNYDLGGFTSAQKKKMLSTLEHHSDDYHHHPGLLRLTSFLEEFEGRKHQIFGGEVRFRVGDRRGSEVSKSASSQFGWRRREAWTTLLIEIKRQTAMKVQSPERPPEHFSSTVAVQGAWLIGSGRLRALKLSLSI